MVEESNGVHQRFCTVKFQGATDHDAAAAFAEIPGAVLFHGAHNRHEKGFRPSWLDSCRLHSFFLRNFIPLRRKHIRSTSSGPTNPKGKVYAPMPVGPRPMLDV